MSPLRLAAAVLVAGAAIPAFGAGTVSGIVRDSLTGAPVGGAVLTLFKPGTTPENTTSVDGTGEFRFESVPTGTYALLIFQRGYVRVRQSPREVPVRVTDGAETKLEPTLTPGASIEGRLVGEDDTPIADATVSASSDQTARTDRQGRFRLEDLAPEPLWVKAVFSDEFRRSTIEKQRGETRGYPPSIHYPESIDLKDATTFHLTPGERRTGVEFLVRREILASFAGTVVDSRTAEPPAEGAAIELADTNVHGQRLPRRPLATSGSFQFDLPRPGEYLVTVYRSSNLEARPIQSTVKVGRLGLAGHRVVLPAASGRIEVRFKGDPPAGLNVALAPPRFGGGIVYGRKIAGPRIVFDDLAPGRWSLSTSHTMVGSHPDLEPPLPRRIVRQAGRVFPVGQQEFDLLDGENEPLELEFLPRFSITGNVAGAGGRPVPDAVIFHQAGSAKILFLGGRKDGSFRIEVDPGEYHLSAWSRDRMRGADAGACPHIQNIHVTGNVSGVSMVACP